MPKKNQILERDAPMLRETAEPIAVKDITSKKIKDIIERMKEAMHAEDDGVAIAAPQIGESLRIFVVNTAALRAVKGKSPAPEEEKPDDLVYINPEILKLSKKKKMMEEGCLSVRWLYGEVSRSEKAVIRAHDEKGKVFQQGASGLLAQIFQHEVDHLNGVLFTDKAKNVRDMPPKEDEGK